MLYVRYFLKSKFCLFFCICLTNVSRGHSKIVQLFESFVFSSQSVTLTVWSVKPNTRCSPLPCNPEPILAQYLPTLHYLASTLCTTSFDFKKFYVVLTLRLCFVYGPQNKQRLLPHTSLTDWFCITEVESVYCAVRSEFLYKTDTFLL
jgi:hypothetical protein